MVGAVLRYPDPGTVVDIGRLASRALSLGVSVDGFLRASSELAGQLGRGKIVFDPFPKCVRPGFRILCRSTSRLEEKQPATLLRIV